MSFKTKADVDRHAEDIFRKCCSDHDKKLKSLVIGKLYLSVKAYDTAVRYFQAFLSVNENSPETYKLIGKCFQQLGKPEKAIASYKRSLELEPPQPALILLICELMNGMNLADVGINSARHWCEKGIELFPNNAVISNLRQKIVVAENKDPKALENFYLSELRSNPNDETLVINLLKFYVDSKQFAAAHKKVLEYQGSPTFHQSLEWHRCLGKVYKICLQETSLSQTTKGDFMVEAVAACDNHLSILHRVKNDGFLDEALCVLRSFDQLLSKLISVPSLKGSVDKDIQKHYQAQLAYHIAVLALKKLVREEVTEKAAKNLIAPSLLFAQASPFDLESSHPSSLDAKYRARMRYLIDDATFRVIQSNLTIRNWFRGATEIEIITSISGVYSNETRNQLFSKLFPNSESGISSCWVSSCFFEKLPQRLLSLSEVLTESNLFSYERRSTHSYHDLVWLGVQTLLLNVANGNQVLPQIFNCQNLPSWPVSSQNLNLVSIETFNKLDVDCFLYLSVFSSYLSLMESKAAWHACLLSDAIPPLATDKQLLFWAAVQKCRKGELGDSMDSKSLLIKGMETVRLIGQHGLDLRLLILVARTFEAHARSAAKQQDALYTSAVEKRAFLFWSNIIRKLELAQVQDVYQSANTFFPYKFSPVKRNEISEFLEEGRFFVAYKKMRSEDYQRALEGFKSLRSPEAALHEALIYKRLALNEIQDQDCDEITAEMHARHNTWLMKAKEVLSVAEERLGDKTNHTLRAELSSLLEEIEGRLVRYDRDFGNEEETESLPSTIDSNIEADSSSYQPKSSFNSTSHDLDFRLKSGNFTPHQSTDSYPRAPDLKEMITTQSKMFKFLEQLAKKIENIEREVNLLAKNVKKTDRRLEMALRHICSSSNPLFQAQMANLLLPQLIQAPSFYPQVVPPMMPPFLPAGMPPFLPPGMMPPILVPPRPNLNVSNCFSHLLPGTAGINTTYSVPYSSTQSRSEMNTAQPSRPDTVTISGSQKPFNEITTDLYAFRMSPASLNQQSLQGGHTIKTDVPVESQVFSNNSTSSSHEQPLSAKQPVFKPSPLTSLLSSQNQLLSTSNPNALSAPGPSASHNQQQLPLKPSFLTNLSTSVPPQSFQPTKTSASLPSLKPSALTVAGSTHSLDSPASSLSEAVLSSSTVSSSNSPNSVQSPPVSETSFFKEVATPQGISTPVKATPSNSSVPSTISQKVSEPLFTLLTKTSSDANSNTSSPASVASSVTEFAGTPKSITVTPVLSKPDNASKSLLKETLLKSVDASAKPENLSFNSFESSPLSDRFSLDFAQLSKNCEPTIRKSDSFKGFEGQGSKVFASSPSTKDSDDSPGGESAEEFVPTAEFQPVVALPDLIEVKTGEEGLTVLYEERCKLMRYDIDLKQWKERGIGKMKILHDPTKGTVRLLMRREQVLKVCCNQNLWKDFSLKQVADSDNAWMWNGIDFSEEEGLVETFAVRFKNSDLAKKFFDAVEDAKKMINIKTTDNSIQNETNKIAPLSELFKPETGSWECSECYTRNSKEKTKCLACEAPNPKQPESVISTQKLSLGPSVIQLGVNTSNFKFGFPSSTTSSFTSSTNSEQQISVGQKGPHLDGKTQNFSFGIPKVSASSPALTNANQMSTTNFSTNNTQLGSSSFHFGTPQSAPSSEASNSSLQKPTLSSASSTPSFTTPLNSRTQTSESENSSVNGSPAPSGSVTDTLTKSIFSFKLPSNKNMPNQETDPDKKAGSQENSVLISDNKLNGTEQQQPLSFSFTNGNSGLFNGSSLFAAHNGTQLNAPGDSGDTCPVINSKLDYSSAPFAFGPHMRQSLGLSLAADSKNLSFSSMTDSGDETLLADKGSDDENTLNNSEDTIHFEPLIPLPDEIIPTTGEEDEDVLYSHLAKLYRYRDGEWKERGTGDIKILRHKVKGAIRFVMRRKPIDIVCLNHYVTKDLSVQPKDSKSWTWTALDFSDGVDINPAEMKPDVFSLRFKNAEIAQQFKDALDSTLNSKPLNGAG